MRAPAWALTLVVLPLVVSAARAVPAAPAASAPRATLALAAPSWLAPMGVPALAAASARPPDSAVVLPAAPVRAWTSGALRADRLQHASLALTIGLAAGLASRRPALAAGTASALGVLKELRDRRRGGRFDAGDLAADAIGAALAAWLTHALD